MQVLASGRKIILVSGEVKFIQILARDHPQRRRYKVKHPTPLSLAKI